MQEPATTIHECDVLVIGSGVAGYCAAIQAGRSGAVTILLEKDAVLGGNSGPDLGVGITGADRYHAYATETGVIQELQEEAAWVGAFTKVSDGTMPYNIHRLNEAVVQATLEAAGVRVLKRHYAWRPVLDGSRIVAVQGEDLAAFRPFEIRVAHVVVEASGDGEIGALAGADFAMGSESQAEYGERSAPAVASPHVQGSSLVAIAHQTDHDVVFVPPPGTPPFTPRLWHRSLRGFLHHTHDGYFRGPETLVFMYVTETGGERDTIRDDGAIYETLLRQLWAEWDHLKNGPHAAAARRWDLLWVSPKAGKRESRRFLGDVVLTQTDLEAGRLFPDDIAYGGHDLDDHRPVGERADIVGLSIPPLYGIPFRACYSRNVPNLLLAGRLVSATHLAHSSIRVMRTGGAVGQAVGLAAALCARHGCTPRELGATQLAELRLALLRADGSAVNVALPDPDDRAPAARVIASSEWCFNDQEPGTVLPLLSRAGNLLHDWPPRPQAAELCLTNLSDAPQPVTLRLYRTRPDRPWRLCDEYHRAEWRDFRDEAFEELAEVAATLAPRATGWQRFGFPAGLELAPRDPGSSWDCLLAALDANPEVGWAVAVRPHELMELIERREVSDGWNEVGVMGTLRLDPPPLLGEAAQVVSGWTRRCGIAPTHLWLSAPEAGLPQSLRLVWPEPQRLTRVEITFDTLTRHRHEQPWENGTRATGLLTRDYTLEVWNGDYWLLLAEVTDNHHRRRVHQFEPVLATELRLRVRATHDGTSGARVYRVAAFAAP